MQSPLFHAFKKISVRHQLEPKENPMEEQNASTQRPLEEVQKDYSTTCAQLGEKMYQKALIESQMNQMQNRLNEINLEANALKAAQDQAVTDA